MTIQAEKERDDPRTTGFSALYEASQILSDQINLGHGLRQLGRKLVMRALQKNRGVQARAAGRLGIPPRPLAYKIHNHRIIKEFRITG
ncbi:MAG: helix-turn-helix domain-containing protein [Candidatus Methylomirabilis sp.]|nr:helix-turn-helix domain-containing protein [Candidatus Methylomirabilis sp.]